MSLPVTIDHRRFEPASRVGGGVRRWAIRLAWLDNHRARRRLRQYAALDRRFVADIGLTPAEFAMLCAAPPWKALTRPAGSAPVFAVIAGGRVNRASRTAA